MKTILQAIGTANPPLYMTQRNVLEMFEKRFALSPGERDLYRRLLRESPIRGRYFGLDQPDDVAETDQDRLVERFAKFARATATQAAVRAMESARVRPSGVAGLVVNTCTGYLCPGLSSYVAESAGLSGSVRPLDIMGMGCGAALPNLQSAAEMAAAVPGRPVVSVAVEICSATLFMDPDPGVIVSNCIFGDGAAAAVLRCVPEEEPDGLMRWVDFESGLFPQHREKLRYRTESHRLRNVLTREVPVIGARAVRDVVDRLLARRELAAASISHWIVHPGGTQVLERVAVELNLSSSALSFSHAVFAEYGNMSSPSVLFVLQKLVQEQRPREGERGVMISFGAGFSAFAALVQF